MPNMSSLDWDEHWETEKEPEKAREFAEKMAERLRLFMKGKQFESVADFGCGPATTLFALARTFPHIDFHGFDVADSIIGKNIEKAREIGLKNLFFDLDSLPDLKTSKKFDLVTCFSTLHYIERIELAIQGLYELVNAKGYLIFNYPNIHTKTTYLNDIKPDDEYMKRRFALLLAGKNLISQRRIAEILSHRPKKFYSSIKSNIYVMIHKA